MRIYYETSQKIYTLFTNHPVMSSLLELFNIDKQNIENVTTFLITNDSEIINTSLPTYYNSSAVIDQLASQFHSLSLQVWSKQ